MSETVHRAVVVARRPGAATLVAGVPLAVRTVLALREAGFGDVRLLGPGSLRWALDPLARRGISVPPLEAAGADTGPSPRSDGSTLLLAGDVLLDGEAAAVLRDAPRGSVRTRSGHQIGTVCPSEEALRCADRLDLFGGSGDGTCPSEMAPSETRILAGLAVPLSTAGSPGRLERVLLDHLAGRASSDSYLAALFDRPMSRRLTPLLLQTSLTPSQVTLLGVTAGLLGAAGLATVSYGGRLGGVLLLILSLVLDCVDGDLARAQLAENPTGARLDVIGDYLVNVAVFAGLAIGLLREGLPPGGGWAVLALVTGVGAAMATVHMLFIRPALRRGGDLHWAGDALSLRGKPGASVLEKLASRDYTYLLLLLALVGRLDWFLYAAAGGAWLFTVGLVAYGLLAQPKRVRDAEPR